MRPNLRKRLVAMIAALAVPERPSRLTKPNLTPRQLNRVDHFLDDVFLAVACDGVPPGEHVPKKARKELGFVIAECNVLHRVDGSRQPLQELERLVFGDVGVVQDEGDFVAKNFHAREQFTQIVLVEVVLKFVKPGPVAGRHRLLEVVSELVLLHERLGEVCKIVAVSDPHHDLDAVFPENLVVSFETALKALPPLAVRQPDDESIEEQGDQSAGGEVVKYFVPRLRVRHDRAEPGVRTQYLSRERVFVRQEQRCDAQNEDRYESYIK